jgi:hypothetical protein
VKLTSEEARARRKELLSLVKEHLAGDDISCGLRALEALRNPGKLEAWKLDPGKNQVQICAAGFAPERIPARPSLPVIEDCVTRSEAWNYDSELRSRTVQRQIQVMEQQAK